MDEITTSQDGMYQNVKEIRELNRVEGFEPRKYMRLIENEGQVGRYYLDVAYRKLWFRLKHPNGKIVKTLKKLTEQVALVEARIYLDRNDPEESFISNALAQKYMSTDDQFGNKYVELAETAAVGRALADAGFGLQFADLEGEADPNIVDAGLEHMDAAENPEEVPADPEEQMGGQAVKQAHGRTAASNNQQPQISMPQHQNGISPNPASGQGGQFSIQEAISQIRRNLPTEEIYKMLNRDMAASLVISAGCFKDKLTLGQLAVEKPQSLSWYVNDYKGPDNLLRASARFLLDAAHAA